MERKGQRTRVGAPPQEPSAEYQEIVRQSRQQIPRAETAPGNNGEPKGKNGK